MLNFIKDYFKKSIKKMAEENEKSFGNGKLDCCDLNKSNNTAKKANTKNK
jgi:hypothetical protein